MQHEPGPKSSTFLNFVDHQIPAASYLEPVLTGEAGFAVLVLFFSFISIAVNTKKNQALKYRPSVQLTIIHLAVLFLSD